MDFQGQNKHVSASYLTHKLNLLGVELLSLSCGKVQLIPHAGNFRVLSSELGLEAGEVSLSCHALLLSPLLLILQLSLQDLQCTQMKEAFRELSDEVWYQAPRQHELYQLSRWPGRRRKPSV